MSENIRIDLFLRYKFDYEEGGSLLDAYDGTKSLHGIAKSINLFTHAFLKNDILRQAPRLQGAKIFVTPQREGSVLQQIQVFIQDPIVIAALGGYSALKIQQIEKLFTNSLKWAFKAATGTNTQNDELGEISPSLVGTDLEPHFNDFQQQTLQDLPEVIEPALIEFHRPLLKSNGTITLEDNQNIALAHFDYSTLQYLQNTTLQENRETIVGNVTRLNGINGNGRLFDQNLNRTVSFELASKEIFDKVGKTLSWSIDKFIRKEPCELKFTILRAISENERTKKYFVYDVSFSDGTKL
ncbi:hypothetical protein KFE96_16625 [Kordiimonas sp. SCSIO 12603]|uniref:DUF7946 domain-containing protein n=1 Tax=Kordiimonas sp. SCSIO 12603 TaxID=2829596 RepID=UPI0021025FA5|nr:hypothetical protein [Kordiimonas sp. SCSIO 12603]UTW58423.1 hypothetical protein KFE96_16625 [Kordiimonas sp. SCSIO 12603]